MVRWVDLWRLPAVKGAVAGVLAVPAAVIALVLMSLRWGIAGPLAYCVLLPSFGLVDLVPDFSAWKGALIFPANAGVGAIGGLALSVRGPSKRLVRVATAVAYGALVWWSLVAFGNAAGR